MAILKRIFRLFFYTFLVLLAFAVGAVAVFTLTGRGRDNLAGLISTMASSPDQQVKISGISGIWSGPLGVENLTISDAEGPWLAARGVEIDWSPLAMEMGARLEDIAGTIHAHPTQGEGFQEAALKALGHAIHI